MNHNWEEYLSGKKLYGDDFSLEQIQQWYAEEAEGYANLSINEAQEYYYPYHVINQFYGFSKIKPMRLAKVLGLGSAYGHEFEPIIDQIGEIIIIEPSEKLRSPIIGNKIIPYYIKPQIDGTIQFAESTFDLITCFGTLHHIPNVSYVLEELIRVLKPGGYILLREPIISMGDWRKPRKGLTKNERGIPLSFFDSFFKKQPIEVIAKNFCFTLTHIFQKLSRPFIKKPIFAFAPYVYLDFLLSKILKGNLHYHAQNKIQKLAPSCIFYVLRKK
ncbi:MAG: class I SAM-dependent methyltransferase [Bacteroidia bacterium]|nr:class I SAM-dependent methyltransferase [Bacteroidia bacterium]